jgi:hypothetical protein
MSKSATENPFALLEQRVQETLERQSAQRLERQAMADARNEELRQRNPKIYAWMASMRETFGPLKWNTTDSAWIGRDQCIERLRTDELDEIILWRLHEARLRVR